MSFHPFLLTVSYTFVAFPFLGILILPEPVHFYTLKINKKENLQLKIGFFITIFFRF